MAEMDTSNVGAFRDMFELTMNIYSCINERHIVLITR